MQKIKNIIFNDKNILKISQMEQVFEECFELQNLDLSSFDTSEVTSLYSLFHRCSSLKSIRGIENFDVYKVTMMSQTFANCESITELDLSSWNTPNLTSGYSMFAGCDLLERLDLSNFDTSKVISMKYMFGGYTVTTYEEKIIYNYLTNLTYLDISNFTFNDTLKSDSSRYMNIFYDMPVNAKVYVKSNVEQSWILSLSATFCPMEWSNDDVIVKTT